MHCEKSDESIVAMIIEPMMYRTCSAGSRRRRYEDKTRFSEGVLALERVKGNSMITQTRWEKKMSEWYGTEKSR
jgi:hypothetical protein